MVKLHQKRGLCPFHKWITELLILQSHSLPQIITHKQFCSALNQNARNFWDLVCEDTQQLSSLSISSLPRVSGTNSSKKTLTEINVSRKSVALQYKTWQKSMHLIQWGKERNLSESEQNSRPQPKVFILFMLLLVGTKCPGQGIFSVYPQANRAV